MIAFGKGEENNDDQRAIAGVFIRNVFGANKRKSGSSGLPQRGFICLQSRSPGVESHWYGFNFSAVPSGTWFFLSFCSTILCMLIFVFVLHGCKKAAVCPIIELLLETKGWGKGQCQPCVPFYLVSKCFSEALHSTSHSHWTEMGHLARQRRGVVGTGLESAYLVSL